MADAMIEELINTLNQLYDTNNPLVSVVKNKLLLFEGLHDLKNIIEMDNVKITIIEQIKLLMTNKLRNKQDNHMLHTVITGAAGAGKTSIARILAKIWISLDMIKKPTKKYEKNYVESLEKEIIEYDYKMEKLNDGLEKQLKLMNKIRIEANGIKNNQKNCHKLLDYVRDARFNLDKIMTVPPLKVEEDFKFTIATRESLIGCYVGHTSPKTKAVLEKAAGGVLFIDEAYSLYTSDRDSFGEECLNVINEFMSLRSDEIIIIFAGYKDLMMNSIFKVQQGLHRRCMWFFDIEDYSQTALTKIFKKQLENNGWLLTPINLEQLFKKYKVFKSPGDTEKLVFQCKIAYSEYHFKNTLQLQNHDSTITLEMLIKAIEKSVRNLPIKNDAPPSHMYL